MNTLSEAVALAIDIGTSSVRTMAYDLKGLLIPNLSTQRHYTATYTTDGGAFFDPIHLREQTFACIDDVLQLPAAAQVNFLAVGVDTFVTNLLGVDNDGTPLTPVYLWNDTRSRHHISQLKLEADTHYDQTGTALHSSYWPSRLLWLKETQPPLWSRVTRWLSVGDWLQETGFGITRCSTSTAAWTGLLNRRSGNWDEPTLDACGISAGRLATIDDSPLGKLSGPFARRWPLLSQAEWHVALSDGYTANVGSGAINAENAALTIGTSAALRVLISGTPDYVPHGLFCYKVNAAQSLIGGAVSNAGNVFAWLQQTLKLTGDPFDRVDDLALPDSHGLTVQPSWAGERSPGWDDNARATISGMTFNTTADDIARAALEAVLYQIATVDDLLSTTIGHQPAILAAGGVLASSPGWAQVTADIFGRPVLLCTDSQASARGTALLALKTYVEPAISATYSARPRFTEIYQAARKRKAGN